MRPPPVMAALLLPVSMASSCLLPLHAPQGTGSPCGLSRPDRTALVATWREGRRTPDRAEGVSRQRFPVRGDRTARPRAGSLVWRDERTHIAMHMKSSPLPACHPSLGDAPSGALRFPDRSRASRYSCCGGALSAIEIGESRLFGKIIYIFQLMNEYPHWDGISRCELICSEYRQNARRMSAIFAYIELCAPVPLRNLS